MVDFDKLLGGKRLERPVNPIQVFDDLDKESGKEYLRDSQKEILKEWFDNHTTDHDVIIKLHTGQGKTLIGLLILQSSLNEGLGPALYLCPNTYLVKQTVEQARSFGIKTVEFEETNRRVEIPVEFKNSEAILVTTCNKLFNGWSAFGPNRGREIQEIGALVMDDAHKCIDIIREAFSFRIPRYDEDNEMNPLYKELLDLFSHEMKDQGEGTFLELVEGKVKEDVVLPVPYWAWYDRKSKVIELLSRHVDNNYIKFPWEFMKDEIANTICIFSVPYLEISPRLINIDRVPSFVNCKRRIFLSATLFDDSFLVRDLQIDPESVKNPLSKGDVTYSGERLIIIPEKVNTQLNRNKIVEYISKIAEVYNEMGVVALVPSDNHANTWKSMGSIVTHAVDLYSSIEDLRLKIKQGKSNKVFTIVNGYDGIDLPDSLCRVLCLDSLPSYSSLYDIYLGRVRQDSDIMRTKLAQRVEQGMGRGIRGQSDWCAVVVTGSSLSNFLLEKRKRRFLSVEARTQLEVSEELMEVLKKEDEPNKSVNKLLQQFLNREEGWKNYYRKKMSNISPEKPVEKNLEILIQEKDAEISYRKGKYQDAMTTIQSIIDDIPTDKPRERGWYLQLRAMYCYPFSKDTSMNIQISAHEKNMDLFRPPNKIDYVRIGSALLRARKIKSWLSDRESKSSLILDLNEILQKLRFGEVDHDTFEQGVQEIGELLGFESQRPEKMFHEGPDNLWKVSNNEYFVIECKNMVNRGNEVISKTEIDQLLGSISWFSTKYDKSDRMKPILFHPFTRLDKGAYCREPYWIINDQLLNNLKGKLKDFYTSFTEPFDNLSEEKISDVLNQFGLGLDNLVKEFLQRGPSST
ncbi:MAG: DEAD/DEAH box helicase family protein [Candidatus Thermoplasmatota archaeon]|nr:DEAD/DEAH box helicase family protein [Candidatus Thermoplasmatota archaeon]